MINADEDLGKIVNHPIQLAENSWVGAGAKPASQLQQHTAARREIGKAFPANQPNRFPSTEQNECHMLDVEALYIYMISVFVYLLI